jgi:hypothetical protein
VAYRGVSPVLAEECPQSEAAALQTETATPNLDTGLGNGGANGDRVTACLADCVSVALGGGVVVNCAVHPTHQTGGRAVFFPSFRSA